MIIFKIRLKTQSNFDVYSIIGVTNDTFELKSINSYHGEGTLINVGLRNMFKYAEDYETNITYEEMVAIRDAFMRDDKETLTFCALRYSI